MTATTTRRVESRLNDLGQYWCPKCERWLDRDDFRANRTRPHGIDGYCRWCKLAQDARYNRLRKPAPPKPLRLFKPVAAPPPPPVPAGEGFDVLMAEIHERRLRAKGLPAAKPERCEWPANPCRADRAWALALDLHEQDAKTFAKWVRGIVATVPETSEAIVAPRFETPIAARMWDDLYRARYGVKP